MNAKALYRMTDACSQGTRRSGECACVEVNCDKEAFMERDRL